MENDYFCIVFNISCVLGLYLWSLQLCYKPVVDVCMYFKKPLWDSNFYLFCLQCNKLQLNGNLI